MTSQPPKWIRLGFFAATVFNFGIIWVSRGFSGNLGAVDPLFSPAGCVLICLWGVAYLSVAHHVHRVPHIAAVFCAEKLFYVATWVHGLSHNDLTAASPDVQLFFRTYGLGDGAFALLFAAAWWTCRKPTTSPDAPQPSETTQQEREDGSQ